MMQSYPPCVSGRLNLDRWFGCFYLCQGKSLASVRRKGAPMKNSQFHSWSNPSSATPLSADRNPSPKLEPEWAIVIWDNQQSRQQLISRLLGQWGLHVRWIKEFSAIEQVKCSCQCSIAVVALGAYPSADNLGLKVIRSLKQNGFEVIGYEEDAHSWSLGVQCQSLVAGASGLLDSAKQAFPQELRRLLTRFLHTEVERQNEEARIKNKMRELGIVGESAAIFSIFRQVLRISKLSDIPILITGESGTGKELLAHAIHQLDGKRGNGPFVALNCGAISPHLAESEFFGHRRGAFTGADRDRKGLIRTAEGGVLFLDEIGELEEALQVKLLRVLQERHVLGVGEDQEVTVSVRVIAATNRNLEELVQQGKFRADLFHRLNVLSLHVPPLRERPVDIKPMIEHFLERNTSLQPAGLLSVDRDFIEALARIDLPGNARQLENLVRCALVHHDGSTPLNLSDLPSEVWQQLIKQEESLSSPLDQEDEEGESRRSPPKTPPEGITSHLVNLLEANGWSLSQSLQYCERLLLEAALRVKHGNQSQTAHLLGITPRSVYGKIRKYHL